jgi:hypothetical protein
MRWIHHVRQWARALCDFQREVLVMMMMLHYSYATLSELLVGESNLLSLWAYRVRSVGGVSRSSFSGDVRFRRAAVESEWVVVVVAIVVVVSSGEWIDGVGWCATEGCRWL